MTAEHPSGPLPEPLPGSLPDPVPGHLSADDISHLEVGLLPPAQAAAAAGHLERCPSCRDTREALAQLRASLAAVQAPALPPHVALRLQRALAEEAGELAQPDQSDQPDQLAQPARLRPLPTSMQPHRPAAHRPAAHRPARRWAPRALAAASVAGVIGLGGAVIAGLTADNGSAPAAGSAAAPAPASSPPSPLASALVTTGPAPSDRPPPEEAGSTPTDLRRAGDLVSPGQAAPGAAGGSAAGAESRTAAGPAAGSPGAGGVIAVTHSERDYAPNELAGAARALASSYPAATPGAAPPAAPEGVSNPAARLAENAALRSCAAGLELTDRVISVDIGRYQGQPAAVFVAAAPADPGALEVRVVGPGCASPQPELLAAQLVRR